MYKDVVESKDGSSRGTRVAEIACKLRALIVGGDVDPGEKLSTEAGLAREYGVSRTVVREAIASLRAAGLVAVRHGVGVFVLDPEAQSNSFRPVDRARISSMIDVLELRAAIEVEAVRLAAERRSPAHEEKLFERFDELNRLVAAGESTVAADLEFHMAVADATNNPRFRECLTLLGAHLIPRSVLPEGPENSAPAEYIEQIQSEHHAIITAVSERDGAGASQAMRTHLQGSAARYRRLIRGK